MSADLFASAALALTAARMAIALWLILASVQWMAALPRLAAFGPLPWQVSGGPLAPLRRRLSQPVLRGWLGAQMLVAALLLLAVTPPLAILGLTLLIASHGALLLLAGRDNSNGADKMGMIAMLGTLVIAIGLARAEPELILAGCLLTGGQLLICYMVSGLSKLCQPHWRSGAELAGVMADPIWGHPRAAALLRHPRAALAASWALMLGEALFPLALLAPQPVLIGALAAMLAFHIATALIMRLNLFPWAFVAAYPAVLLLGEFVRMTPR